ncbi:carboxylate/amino acid/amine transporter [Amantichitinum ursilacus]|uniref:EamA-like transporter family protein n=1 Tax=Amantichitinum ursilacus TaxID=857265 RepID=A0A0N0GPW1_9NEIS|nr:carboxylate/amino acid/amine transporter [Amantichitinum ursilacus]KPC53872.1 EamA-like transporter family protein [Amantichitinum ursilacus]
MPYLAAITLVWAVSFNLIGVFLAGQVDSDFAVLTRVALAGLVFLPFTRWRNQPTGRVVGTLLAGALQFGLTYLCLYRSFRFLSVAEVLLFTIFTPIYVTLLDDLLQRRFQPRAFAAALVAVIGSLVIRYDHIDSNALTGFLLLQLANVTFAAGQVGYRYVVRRYPDNQPQYRSFGFFFLGALCVALPSWLIFGNMARLPHTPTQYEVLAFLGLISSALGFYWWNKGATRVDAGTLGAMNNMHIPVGLLINLVVWNQNENIPRLLLGGAIMASALLINRRWH